jgi:glutathione S-transferase
MRLLGIPWSTNVERVTLALAYKRVEAELVEVDPSDRSQVRQLSGQELVPVLIDGDDVVADSLTILRHLERRHPDPPLWPSGPARRAELDLALEWFDRVWKVAPNAIESDPGRTDELAAMMDAHLDMFEGLLYGRDHLLGELTALDFAAYPFLKYAAGRDPADDEPFHRILDEHQSVEGRPGLAGWIRRTG